jgi:DNA invertase Pin-like site-specific DNA recombinase
MIAAYLRVSSDEQREQKTIEHQRIALRDYCKTRELQVEFYEDDGLSGDEAFEQRTGGARLLKDLTAGKADRVLVWDIKRLGRDMLVLITALAQIEKYAPFESMTEGAFSLKDPAKILITAVHCGMASADKATLLFKTKTASRNLAAGPEGMWMGGVAPYGYRQVGEDREARLAVSEEPISAGCKLSEAEVVRLIFQKAANGESCWEITKHLTNDLGIPPAYADPGRDARRGGRNRTRRRRTTKGIWWSTGVRSIILNRTYMGEHIWGKQMVTRDEDRKRLKSAPREQWITRQCPAIVSPEQWAQANAMLHRSQTARIGHPKHQYLLRSLIRCECGRTYIGVTAKQRNGTERAYYRCASKYADRSIRDISPRCSAPGLRGEALESSIWDHVAGFLARPGLAIRQLKNQMAAEATQGRVAGTIKDLEASRARKIEGRKAVLRQLGDGLFPEGDVKETVQGIDAAMSEIDARLAQFRKIADKRQTRLISLDWAGRLLGELRTELLHGELTFEKKRKFVESLVAGIKIPNNGPPEVTFRFEPDLQRFEKWRRSGLVPSYTGPDPA